MKSKVELLLKLLVAGILIQTLFFKFTGAAESKFIFSALGVEPWGRWASGFCELTASVLLFLPKTQIFGALMALGIMIGALLSHLLVLGIVVQDDGGLLFGMACTVALASFTLIILAWKTR